MTETLSIMTGLLTLVVVAMLFGYQIAISELDSKQRDQARMK